MKHLLFLTLLFVFTFKAQCQNSIGLRLGILLNTIHDCYDDDKDYKKQPASMGLYGFYFRQFSPDWGIQAELGYSQRNTHVTGSGGSHYYSNDYHLKQIEISILGKFPLDVITSRLALLLGVTGGYALTGREHTVGGSVGPTSINLYQDVNFDNFDLKRFQIGPVFGLEITQPLFGAGEALLDSRFAYYPEKDLHNCDHPHESRFSFSLGYRFYLKSKTGQSH